MTQKESGTHDSGTVLSRHPRLSLAVLLGVVVFAVGSLMGESSGLLGLRLEFVGVVVALFGVTGIVAVEFQRRFDRRM